MIRLMITSPEEMKLQLVQAFEEGMTHIGDWNDLLVVWANSFGPAFDSLQEYIVARCGELKVPVHVARIGASKDQDEEAELEDASLAGSFFTGGKRGVVLGDMASVQGCEFKSVIMFLNFSLKR